MGESSSESGSTERRRRAKLRLPLKITTVSWWDLIHTLGPILLASAVAIWLALHFVRPLPPQTLTMSGGPKGSSFEKFGEMYRAFLAADGIKLKIIPSAGSLQNFQRLTQPNSQFDIALVQSGITETASKGGSTADLVSLGSMFYQPLTIFYRWPCSRGTESSWAARLGCSLSKERQPARRSSTVRWTRSSSRAILRHRRRFGRCCTPVAC
jgi:hypothetical protein